MQLEDAEKWMLALCFGAFLIAIYFWSRFDEPSYDSETEYFVRYKPRFATSFAPYMRAKLAYLGIILMIFLTFSLVPELINVMLGDSPPKLAAGAVPVVIALGLIGAQNTAPVQDLERRIRGFLHALARIPHRVRRTVAQMRTVQFTCLPEAMACQTRLLKAPGEEVKVDPATLNKLIADDETVNSWYVVGCLLWALSEKNRHRTEIDSSFFDYYKDELESIAAKHLSLVAALRGYLGRHAAPYPAAIHAADAGAADVALFQELRDLRERLYTFIACGIHSSVKNDVVSSESIRKLGFDFAWSPGDIQGIKVAAGLSVIALLMLSGITGFLTLAFRDHVLLRVEPAWVEAFPVPSGEIAIFAWSWTTAAFYFAAIIVALSIRSARINKREWFEVTSLSRERPIVRYVAPVLSGTALGCLTLTLIALRGGPAFQPSVSEITTAIGGALQQSLPWTPLATMMAVIAVALSDSPVQIDRFWRDALGRAAGAAAAMIAIGYLTAQLSVSTRIAAFAAEKNLPLTSPVSWTGFWVSLFIATQIGLFAFVLCLVAQVSERLTGRNRPLGGRTIDAIAKEQRIFSIRFEASGAASLLVPDKGHPDAASILCRGRWQHYPEGTAVTWDREAGGGNCCAGSFGLISSYGNSRIYEGYLQGFARKPDFFAQVHERTNGDGDEAITPVPYPVPPVAAARPRSRNTGTRATVIAHSSNHEGLI